VNGRGWARQHTLAVDSTRSLVESVGGDAEVSVVGTLSDVLLEPLVVLVEGGADLLLDRESGIGGAVGLVRGRMVIDHFMKELPRV